MPPASCGAGAEPAWGLGPGLRPPPRGWGLGRARCPLSPAGGAAAAPAAPAGGSGVPPGPPPASAGSARPAPGEGLQRNLPGREENHGGGGLAQPPMLPAPSWCHPWGQGDPMQAVSCFCPGTFVCSEGGTGLKEQLLVILTAGRTFLLLLLLFLTQGRARAATEGPGVQLQEVRQRSHHQLPASSRRAVAVTPQPPHCTPRPGSGAGAEYVRGLLSLRGSQGLGAPLPLHHHQIPPTHLYPGCWVHAFPVKSRSRRLRGSSSARGEGREGG